MSSRWREEAACRAAPPQWFTLDETADTPEKVKAYQQNILLGQDVCRRCPVTQECGDSATDTDRFVSTRGGDPPRGHLLSGRPSEYSMDVFETELSRMPDAIIGQRCPKGHLVLKIVRKKCKECYANAHQRHRKRMKRANLEL